MKTRMLSIGEVKRYKYIHFKQSTENFNGKPMYDCVNNRNKSTLARIFWFKTWKEYCFTQYEKDVIFNDGCLSDVIDFIKWLKGEIK